MGNLPFSKEARQRELKEARQRELVGRLPSLESFSLPDATAVIEAFDDNLDKKLNVLKGEERNSEVFR